jgi:hypothetical protein
MLSNKHYDKVKILHEMSSLLWFVKEHAIKEAAKHDNEMLLYYKGLEHDLEKHIAQLEGRLLK